MSLQKKKNSIWDSNQVDLQRKRTISCIYLAWFIRCILKNRGVNFLLNEWPWFLYCIGAFFLVDFSWNFNRVDLQGIVTIFCVALSWIILFYLKNTGVNFLLSYCIIFFGLLGVFCFASFVWNWFTSISKEKGPFSVILSDVLFFVLSRIQA